MNIGIIFGGKSFEHDISIISAYQLKKKLCVEYQIHLLYVDMNNNLFLADKVKLSDFKENRLKKLKKLDFNSKIFKRLKLDFIVGAMHGENGEDGLAYSLCSFYKIPYLGCETFAGSVAIDKFYTYKFLSSNGVKMIETIKYNYKDYLNKKKIEFMPCIIKPCRGGSSIGIKVCYTYDDLDGMLLEGFVYADDLIIQPYYSKVSEYNLALNENYYSKLESINKKDEFFSFENKYSDSFKQMHQALVYDERYKEFCEISRNVYNLLGCKGIIRIDYFLIDNTIIVNEVNTTPGALSMYLFENFNEVFNDSVKELFNKKNIVYDRGNFLINSDIEK